MLPALARDESCSLQPGADGQFPGGSESFLTGNLQAAVAHILLDGSLQVGRFQVGRFQVGSLLAGRLQAVVDSRYPDHQHLMVELSWLSRGGLPLYSSFSS